ncbi:MAG: flagellar biosynthesis protein FlhB [Rhodospirillaceae bacterium]|jgi:flagellar biosynthesis protein FlhB|nr:flagellar biosynthesis protein FlhB [Rhodospirillaceae bacterium]MBT5658566.1 flagellar biosynthesis protein FlhB [Rhodospirillaceae bacterium]MBT5752783.1 flagellar biosynthesis protein FlhB [Rhodospirillaceae bacterium]
MAEGEDDSQKTEDPTQKRLSEGRKKGQVATSREVNHWLIITAGTLLIMMYVPGMMRNISELLSRFIESPGQLPADFANLRGLMKGLVLSMMQIMLVPIIFMIAVALATGLLQHGLIFSVEKIKPSLEKISLLKGLKRMFSLNSIMEFLKGILKLSIVATVGTVMMLPEFDKLALVPQMDLPDVLGLIHELAIKLLIGVVSIVTVIAGLDFAYQKFQFMKQMRMSKQEIKDEYKQSEGDPMVKSRLRQIRAERARQRMMAEVPDSDVVITNPTHFAIALKYDQLTMEAPLCIAKGADEVALRIRAVAKEHDITIVENPPLAQALFAGVEINEEIPEEHYKAVAEIIGYVYKVKNRFMN